MTTTRHFVTSRAAAHGLLAAPGGPPAVPTVSRIDVEGVIAPATARYVMRAIRQAEEARAEALLIRLDTPGGLLKSMDDITKAMLNSAVPIIVYVAPEGARAASAGVFVTYAAHIAVMAPATRIGAAHPVGVGQGGEGEQDKTLLEKVTNDAVANIRGIARRRGRNADWAEKAVRESVSVDEVEALRLRVVDLVARDEDNLLRAVDGRKVTTAEGAQTLQTRRAHVVTVGMDVTEQFLRLLSDPNVGFILLNIGIIGILAEICNPGLIAPAGGAVPAHRPAVDPGGGCGAGRVLPLCRGCRHARPARGRAQRRRRPDRRGRRGAHAAGPRRGGLRPRREGDGGG